MSGSILKKLTIEHLRGCVRPFILPFEKGKKLTVIYGENGTGKTTICDSFEFLGKGELGSLDNRGLGKTGKYWCTIGKKTTDISVSLETGDATCTAKCTKSGVIVLPPEARPQVEVLRRSQVLSIVEATPGDRYTAISRFVDVAGVEISEASLQELIKSLNKNRETAIARVLENVDTIHQFWETAGKLGSDQFSWAKKELAADVSALMSELSALGKLRLAHGRLLDYPMKYKEATDKLKTTQEEVTAANIKLADQLKAVVEGAGEMVVILEAAKPFLEKHPQPTICPLCESAEKAGGLLESVNTRLAQFTLLQAARREKTKAEQSADISGRRLKELQVDVTQIVKSFEAARGACKWSDDVKMPEDKCPDEIDKLVVWLEATKDLQEVWMRAESARQGKSHFLDTLKKAFDTYNVNVEAQKVLDKLLPRLQKVLEIIQEERRKFTDSVLAAISVEVGRLYELVHPGEGLNKISMALDPGKRASLELGANFCGQADTPPQAYFSQSHLDTLGLCVFLALSSGGKPENTILVLDDILASVDEPHVERLIEMLYTEVMKFRHCIITTHYRPWKVKLRWGWLQNGQCHFVELAKWTTTDGLTLIRSIPDIARLKELLQETPPDPQLVCAKAGVILEAGLDFLTLLYECSVPRRPNGLYTLGDLLPAINKKLKEALKVDLKTGVDAAGASVYKTVALKPVIDELTRIAQARNVFGAHFNALSFDLLEGEAIGFGQNVLNLMEVLTDAEVGWPRNSKSGMYWATSGETRRLYPLLQPT